MCCYIILIKRISQSSNELRDLSSFTAHVSHTNKHSQGGCLCMLNVSSLPNCSHDLGLGHRLPFNPFQMGAAYSMRTLHIFVIRFQNFVPFRHTLFSLTAIVKNFICCIYIAVDFFWIILAVYFIDISI